MSAKESTRSDDGSPGQLRLVYFRETKVEALRQMQNQLLRFLSVVKLPLGLNSKIQRVSKHCFHHFHVSALRTSKRLLQITENSL